MGTLWLWVDEGCGHMKALDQRMRLSVQVGNRESVLSGCLMSMRLHAWRAFNIRVCIVLMHKYELQQLDTPHRCSMLNKDMGMGKKCIPSRS